MHSDFLNQDKICEMFNEEQDLVPRKQQVSLNFTVTSRQSKGPHATYQSKTHIQFQNNHQIQRNHKFGTNLKLNSPQRSIGNALQQLDKFNDWLNSQNKQNQKLLSEVSTLTSLAENSRSILLNMPDFNYIRKKCSKSVKINGSNAGQKNFGQNYYFEAAESCLKCKQKDELIEIINEQYNAKLDEFYAIQKKLKQYQQREQIQIKQQLRVVLLDGVELNMVKQQNQNLNTQITNLKMQIERQKLEKSIIMQKSTSLLKTKQLQKKSDSSCTNSKLFSNAKYSTNALNPNDTINRVDSIICFGDTEPNLEELIRFYGEQSNATRLKCKQYENNQQKRGSSIRRTSLNEVKNVNVNYQQIYRKLSQLYKQIQVKLIDLKSYKSRNAYFFNSYMKERRGIQQDQLTLSNRQQRQQFKKTIANLEKKIKGIENQNNNLVETNNDLVKNMSALVTTCKKNEQQLKKHVQYIRMQEENLKKIRNQCRFLYDKCKIEDCRRKKTRKQLEDLKGQIRFYCRVKQRSSNELKNRSTITYSEDNKIIKDNKQYEFNTVFGEQSTQSEIFKEIRGAVECAYDGQNLCIFAYGQTGSGKTFTMHGNRNIMDHAGLAYNVIQELYDLIQSDTKLYDTVISMGVMQIYNQQIQDLLGISQNVQVKQDPQKGVYLEDYKFIKVKNVKQLIQLYQTSRNNLAKDDSRSNFVFSMLIEKSLKKPKQKRQIAQKQPNQFGGTIISKITLVDLAGSQKCTNSNPINIKDANSVNKTLSNLANVLSAVKNKSQYIPYKDSKLTFLLKDSLSANSKVITFININPSEACSVETSNSLNFAIKAKSLQRSLSKFKQLKQKQGKQNEKNRRSSTRLSIG